MDGETINGTLRGQLPMVDHVPFDSAGIITYTAGGNDISHASFEELRKRGQFDRRLTHICKKYDDSIRVLRDRFPHMTLLLNTLYDPTEGTGSFNGMAAGPWEAVEHLHGAGRINLGNYIRRAYSPGGHRYEEKIILCDVYKLFLNHGSTHKIEDQWYWRRCFIEPNAEGARQIANLWFAEISKSPILTFSR